MTILDDSHRIKVILMTGSLAEYKKALASKESKTPLTLHVVERPVFNVKEIGPPLFQISLGGKA